MTTTVKQIRRHIGGTDMLVLAEANGTMWATNRIWLTRAEHVQPFLDKHGIEGPGVWHVNGSEVRQDGAEPPDVAKFLNLADYAVPLKNATIGDYEKVYTAGAGDGYGELFVNSDGAEDRYAAVRADWLDWLEGAPLSADGHLFEMRLATTERRHGPVAIIAEPLDGELAEREIAAVVMPLCKCEETAPCLDCGKVISYIDDPWYPVDEGGVCVPCGEARGISKDHLL